MSVLYISNIGQMACFNEFVWINARKEFNYTESIFIVSSGLESEARKYIDENSHVIILAHPFHGTEYYEKYIDKIVKTVVTIINDYRRSGLDIEEIIINTAGGTEKMSLIIKDCVEILNDIHPNVRQIWGAFAGTTSIYTEKPNIDSKSKSNEILAKHLIGKREKAPLKLQTVLARPVPARPDPEQEIKEVPSIPTIPAPIQISTAPVEITRTPEPDVKKKTASSGKSEAQILKEKMEKEESLARRKAKKQEKARVREVNRKSEHVRKMYRLGKLARKSGDIEQMDSIFDNITSYISSTFDKLIAEEHVTDPTPADKGMSVIEFIRKSFFESDYKSSSDESIPVDEKIGG